MTPSASTISSKSFIFDDRAPALAEYPHAKCVNGFVFISGVSSRRLDGSRRGVKMESDGSWTSDMEEQTRGVIENIQTLLQKMGADLTALMDLTVFLTDMKNYPTFNKVYNEYFQKDWGPARTTVAVSQLPHPSLLIEIKAVAALPSTS